ncbi:hypothetical protein T439DRAFT_327808 [Meredithblackwellia eburnea MCA 4105]
MRRKNGIILSRRERLETMQEARERGFSPRPTKQKLMQTETSTTYKTQRLSCTVYLLLVNLSSISQAVIGITVGRLPFESYMIAFRNGASTDLRRIKYFPR